MHTTPANQPTDTPPDIDPRLRGAERLRIGGFTRLTTIDYPGELAAVVFCQGCPWRCRYCHNTDLLDTHEAARLSWPDIRGFLKQRVGLLDAVVFSGGEPTAQGALAGAIADARALGYKIGLHTSGAYPERLRPLLTLVDWIGLDIKALPGDYAAITSVADSGARAWESLDMLLNAGIALEVRTTLMPGWTPEQVGALGHALADAGVVNYRIQTCDTANALDPGLIGHWTPPRQLIELLDTGRFPNFSIRGDLRGD